MEREGTGKSRRAAVWLLLLLPGCCSGASVELVPGRSHKIDFSSVRRVSFTLTLNAETVADVRLDQSEGDLSAAITDPGGERREVDQFDFGVEQLTIKGKLPGSIGLKSLLPREIPGPRTARLS